MSRAPAAVHSIDHFALNVPSITDAQRFFTTFGLDVREVHAEGGSELELRALDGHRWGRILPASRKSLAYLSFSCFDGDLDRIAQQVREAGGQFDIDVAELTGGHYHSSKGVWFTDLDGNLLHVNVGPKTSPSHKEPFGRADVPPDIRGAHTRSQVRPVRPRRMSHVLLFTPETARAAEFHECSLGLRLTDRSADIIAFLHGIYGSDHHLIAFAKSRAKGWHHVSWDVRGIDEVGEGSAQMAAAGYRLGWGTGRHVLGSNYFHYVMDPWGSFSEYSSDIDFITAGKIWAARSFPREDALYLWGPELPEYFTTNTEA